MDNEDYHFKFRFVILGKIEKHDDQQYNKVYL